MTALLAPVEKTLNSALSLDSESRHRLRRIGVGKTLRIECTTPLAWQLTVQTTDSGLRLLAHHEEAVDCSISGTASSLAQLLLSDNPQHALHQHNIHLGGDSALAADMQRLIADLDIDWEDRLAPWLGDVVSHQLSRFARHSQAYGRQSLDRIARVTEEYLHEEARLLPSREEVSAFSERTDELRLRLDRLQARLDRLAATVSNATN